MSNSWTDLKAGDAITRWAISEIEEIDYPGVARPMPDTVDYRFFNGWVQTGDLPCREAWRAEIPNRDVAMPEGPFDQAYIGLSGPDMDFSEFYFTPTFVRRAFRAKLKVDQAGMVRFRLSTCGGVHIWLGEQKVARFEPFDRNHPKTTEINFAAEAGEHQLTVLLEDLHERDTTFFFSLIFEDGPAGAFALPDNIDGDAADALALMLDGVRVDPIFSDGDDVCLVADTPPPGVVDVRVGPLVPFVRGGVPIDPGVTETIDVTLSPDMPRATLFASEAMRAGCLSMPITARYGQIELSRQLGITNLPGGVALEGSVAERKAQAADIIAGFLSFEPAVAALLAIRGEHFERMAYMVDVHLMTIETRYDCSDFTILSMLRIWRDAREGLGSDLEQRFVDAFLGWRYWLDEPGDDVMWFWSENHVLCFHAAQAIAGSFFPDRVFENSGKTGQVLYEEASARLDRWFASIFEHGLCEWNSAAYYPIDLLALFSLHDMAPAFRDRSAELMDRIFAMAGLHTSGGVPGGSQGRCYEKELFSGPVNELGSALAIAFGGVFRPGVDNTAALLCLSDYEPPEIATRFAKPAADAWIDARYTQGMGHAGKLTLWKSADGQISTVTDLDTGELGHQAQVVDVQMAGHPMAHLWINHPGELKVWGSRRPSLLAGNHIMPRVAQDGPTAMLIYDLDRYWSDIKFTQLFAPSAAFDRQWGHGAWRVFQTGQGRVAVWCSLPMEEVTGPYAGSMYRAHGLQVAWVVTLALPGEADAEFTARLDDLRPEFDAKALKLACMSSQGSALELCFADGLKRDGVSSSFGPLTTIPQVGWNGQPLVPWRDATP